MNPLQLDAQLCFPLYAASREVVKQYTPFLSALGLTYTQYITLMALWEEPRMGVKRLGERLFLDSGTLTPLLKRLEKQGYVTRQRSSTDERNVDVLLTPKGQALRARAEEIPHQVARCLPLDLAEAQTLYALLYKILGKDDHHEPL
jgi:DNA-binding MarR family transcriptional regulator